MAGLALGPRVEAIHSGQKCKGQGWELVLWQWPRAIPVCACGRGQPIRHVAHGNGEEAGVATLLEQVRSIGWREGV